MKKQESTSLDRRQILATSAAIGAMTALKGTVSARSASLPRPVLVQVFLRGGMDGLTTVVPYGDPDLYGQRGSLAIQPPGTISGAINLDGFFGLAPAAAPLRTPWSDGRLAIVHASGSQSPTRSHFAAYDKMEGADVASKPGTGWAARYLVEMGGASARLRGLVVDNTLPLSLKGAPKTLAMPRLGRVRMPGHLETEPGRIEALLNDYTRAAAPVGPGALDTIRNLDFFDFDFDSYPAENGATYPADSLLGRRMRQAAALIKADLGLEVIHVELPGWDLHIRLGELDGSMALLLDELSRCLEAFYLDLLAYSERYILICMTEFGRRLQPNFSGGLDHGHGSAMFVMGHRVHGGQVIADWPGLGDDDLDNGDLAVTIDFRDVVGEVLTEVLGVTNLAPIFPGFTMTRRGVIV